MSQPHALLIDDNVQNLRVLARMLSKEGWTATEVAQPALLGQALAGLQSVDAVFLDLEMPTTDGFAVKDWLREQLDDVPIIAYTVHVSEIQVTRDAGFDGFIGKPLNAERFAGQLARIVKRLPVWERA
jgi:two-component system, cell cycle response regulator DivK